MASVLGGTEFVTVVLLWPPALRSLLGNWKLCYKVANYIASLRIKLRTLKQSSQLWPD